MRNVFPILKFLMAFLVALSSVKAMATDVPGFPPVNSESIPFNSGMVLNDPDIKKALESINRILSNPQSIPKIERGQEPFIPDHGVGSPDFDIEKALKFINKTLSNPQSVPKIETGQEPFMPADPKGPLCIFIPCPIEKLPLDFSSSLNKTPLTFAASKLPDSNVFASNQDKFEIRMPSQEEIALSPCYNSMGFRSEIYQEFCKDIVRESDKTVSCSPHVRALLDFRSERINEADEPETAPYTVDRLLISRRHKMSIEQASQKLDRLLLSYFQKCLQVVAPEEKPEGVPDSAWKQIEASVGSFFRFDGQLPFCSGFFTNDRLITAGHCFPFSRQRIREALHRATFVTLNGTIYDNLHLEDVFVADDRLNDNPPNVLSISTDVIAISTKHMDPKPEFLPNAENIQGERIISVGNYNELDGIEAFKAARNADDYRQNIAVDSGPMCRSYVRSDSGCMMHACQTTGGLSGSPLIRIENDSAHVVAMQRGFSFEPPNLECSGMINPQIAPNVGISIKAVLGK